MTTGGEPVLRVTGVRKSFTTPAGSATVLDGIDLAVHGGEIVALAGRSGSGKTVLLTVIAGWEQPDAGTVVLPRHAGRDAAPNPGTHAVGPDGGRDAGPNPGTHAGRSTSPNASTHADGSPAGRGTGADASTHADGPDAVAALSPTAAATPTGPPGAERPWRELAVVPQSLGLLDELTVEENIFLPHRLDPRRRPGDTPHELAARLGIDHLAGRFPSEISRGEQQRVALARAATLGPRLLLADEPIAHQNEAWAEVVLAVIADLAAGGTACLLATHDELAFRAAHRVVHLTNGHLDPLTRARPGGPAFQRRQIDDPRHLTKGSSVEPTLVVAIEATEAGLVVEVRCTVQDLALSCDADVHPVGTPAPTMQRRTPRNDPTRDLDDPLAMGVAGLHHLGFALAEALVGNLDRVRGRSSDHRLQEPRSDGRMVHGGEFRRTS